MNPVRSFFAYQQTDPIRPECTIDLGRLFETEEERARFDEKWEPFLHSDPYNESIFRRSGNKLSYYSEHLIPRKEDSRPPLLLIFGNPASHSVAADMFFAFKDNGRENRFWKSILAPAGVLSLLFDESLPVKELNALRLQQLTDLNYESPFRIGLSVFISMPSAPAGPWGGVAGIRKLIGVRALRLLEAEETKRIIKCAKAFIGDDPRGELGFSGVGLVIARS